MSIDKIIMRYSSKRSIVIDLRTSFQDFSDAQSYLISMPSDRIELSPSIIIFVEEANGAIGQADELRRYTYVRLIESNFSSGGNVSMDRVEAD